MCLKTSIKVIKWDLIVFYVSESSFSFFLNSFVFFFSFSKSRSFARLSIPSIQCDQMDKLLVQNLPKIIIILPKYVEHFAKFHIHVLEMAKGF